MSIPPTDRELFDRAKQGDRAAFGEFVRKVQPRIERLAVHMLRDRMEAEDVAQETFVRAYSAIARFDGRSEPFTWVYRIAVNLCLNTIRSRKSARISGDVTDARLTGLLVETRPGQGDPGGDAARRQVYRALCVGIDALSESLRTTLILVSIDGLSHDEVSRILGAPEGTIAWRVHEARKKLKEHLQTQGFDVGGDEP